MIVARLLDALTSAGSALLLWLGAAWDVLGVTNLREAAEFLVAVVAIRAIAGAHSKKNVFPRSRKNGRSVPTARVSTWQPEWAEQPLILRA
jgi:hypothetical protein